MNRYTVCALSAGVLWGGIGLFSRSLTARGFDMWSQVAIRCGLAALLYALWLLLRDRSLLRVRLRDVWCLLGVGLAAMLCMSFCYFNAIARLDLSTASVLLYTAPVFVMLLSRPFFAERMGRRGAAALTLCFAGVVLVCAPGRGLNTAGLLYGLGAGASYALYSIFSRFALNRGIKSMTITFYACLLAAAGALCFVDAGAALARLSASPSNALLCLGLALVSCVLPYGLYTYALTGIPNGRASVMSTVEPVVATLLSVGVYGEALAPTAALGIALVLGAIVVMNWRQKPRRRAEEKNPRL